MLVHWIWLAHRPCLTDWMKWEILKKYGDPERVYFAESYEKVEDLTREGYDSLMDKNLESSEKILEVCLNKGLRILTAGDGLYPERLKNIADPPLVLYYRGTLPNFDATAVIGCVGTRKASPYGLDIARRMGYQISKSGGIVVSGMALGIDAMAMSGGLLGGSTVVGVLGCGADRIYPMKNKKLFEDVCRYGCILSEFPPESPGLPWHFPRRNRIISGLSSGVLVVEAPRQSGALITARQALEQSRDVFVVPGQVGSSTCEGSNKLLREGAQMVSSGWDILEEYTHLYPDALHRETGEQEPRQRAESRVAQPRKQPERRPEKPEKPTAKTSDLPARKGQNRELTKKLSIDNQTSQSYIDINDILQKCNSQEKTIVLALQKGEQLVDNVIAETGLKSQEVLAGLTMLEIKGFISRLPGRRVSLRKK